MKKYNNKEINNDICQMHLIKYSSYCFNCNKHLCFECLKTREHITHNKNNIIEIEPKKEELKIIENNIRDYENQIEELGSESIRINQEIKKKEDKRNQVIKLKEIAINKTKNKKESELIENKNTNMKKLFLIIKDMQLILYIQFFLNKKSFLLSY